MFAANKSAAPSGDQLFVEDVFATHLFTGNSGAQTINNGIDLAGEGGMVWLKSRAVGYNHTLYDTLRGVNNSLGSNQTDAQVTATPLKLTAFNSNGFSLGANENSNLGGASVSWTFRQAPRFFRIVTWTGNGVAGRQIPHDLGVAPGMVVIKRTDSTSNWTTWHRSAGGFAFGLALNTTSQAGAINSEMTAVSPTSVTVNNSPSVNGNGGQYCAYVWAHDDSDDGLIQCGSFTTDASGNATVTLPWEPQFLLWKRADAATDWWIADSMRGWPADANYANLKPNSSEAESSLANYVRPTSTGFKAVAYGSGGANLIYLAIRRGPMRFPESGQQVYQAIARTGTGAVATVTGVGFPPDLMLSKPRGLTYPFIWQDRLRGPFQYLSSGNTNAEGSGLQTVTAFGQDGVSIGTDAWINTASAQHINYFLRRYPGALEISAWDGNGNVAGKTIAHNLQAVPELAFLKCRNVGETWLVASPHIGAGYAMALQSPGAKNAAYGSRFDLSGATDSAFSVKNNDGSVNGASNKYVAYLLASLNGVQKIGKYTGNGGVQTIDCGFTSGARFVYIKCIDYEFDHYIWDSVRGIVAGNDPHLSLNSTATEVTSDDSIDPVAQGFVVNQVAATNVNVNGASYLYWAIA